MFKTANHPSLLRNNLRNGLTTIFHESMAIAILLFVGYALYISYVDYHQDLNVLRYNTISLDITNLPYYALLTTMRIFYALLFSLIFTLLIAICAAKNRLCERIILPLIDILQAVPILGYLSITVSFFIALGNNTVAGLELAAIFAIFTSQLWNMIFSAYQSFKTIPPELYDVAAIYKLSSWQKFINIELPYAIPGLLWNMMISMSGSWFFIVASEAITVGEINYILPGIGGYVALALASKNVQAIIYSIITLFTVVIIYDQLYFKPLLAWADKYKYELSSKKPKFSWFYRVLCCAKLLYIIINFLLYSPNAIIHFSKRIYYKSAIEIAKTMDYLSHSSRFKIVSIITNLPRYRIYLYYFCYLIALFYIYKIILIVYDNIELNELSYVLYLTLITSFRIVILLLITSLIWLPIGVYIGLRPKVAEFAQPILQFLAALPANFLFPVFSILITHFKLDPNIWLSPLIVLGTQWYILFNVISGVAAISTELQDTTYIYKIEGFTKWRFVILPAIAPYLITGLITAFGGAWNASVIAEAINWGDQYLYATGIGAYIAKNTVAGNFSKIFLGISVMSIFVLIFNKIIWRPLYEKTITQLHLE